MITSPTGLTAPGSNPFPSFTTSFNYDKTDQLTGTTSTLTNNDKTYNYDPTGIRTTSNVRSTSQSYTTATGNRLTRDGQFEYSYDVEGDLPYV